VAEMLYNGETLKQAFKAAELLLEKRIEEVNSLNVFPVPDGDTGINMYLTLQSANEAIKGLSTNSAAEISSKAAMGALLGARGNSGVIFSQIMRGLAKGLENKDNFTAYDFAQALQRASDTAYKAIAEPVEGTILTVIREAAGMAMEKAQQGANLQKTISAVTIQAKETVIKTQQMLPCLKEAGVVDAGGKGLFYVFQGMKNFIVKNMNPVEGIKAVRGKARIGPVESAYGYDLQFLIEGTGMPITEIRAKIKSLGESVLVVGDESLIRVHVHTQIPQTIMDFCSTKGCLKDIINDNMDTQVENFKKIQQEETTAGHSPNKQTRLSGSTISP
jgi:uncharacterized protein